MSPNSPFGACLLFYIPTEEVDEWARETGSTFTEEVISDDDGNGNDTPEQGESEGVNPGPCANNWKAAQSDSKKRMWGIFAETGLFASACRHGFILWITDMVQTGEQ